MAAILLTAGATGLITLVGKMLDTPSVRRLRNLWLYFALSLGYQQRFEEALERPALDGSLGEMVFPLVLGKVCALAGRGGGSSRREQRDPECRAQELRPARLHRFDSGDVRESEAAFEWAAKAVEQRDPTILDEGPPTIRPDWRRSAL